MSVDDLHRGLSSFVFRMKQITQNPVVAIPCGFDPRFRHQKSTVVWIELRWTFSMLPKRLESGFSTISAYNEPRCGAIRGGALCVLGGIAVSCSAVIVKLPSKRWTTGVFVKPPSSDNLFCAGIKHRNCYAVIFFCCAFFWQLIFSFPGLTFISRSFTLRYITNW